MILSKKENKKSKPSSLPDNFESLKIAELKAFCKEKNISIPVHCKKKVDIIEHIYRIVAMDLINDLVDCQKEQIIEDMTQSGIYSKILNPMINSYLEIYEVYITMFSRWRDLGFPETQSYTNKSGATNDSKHPLAQMVEVWSEKQMKALEKLGLTNRSLISMQLIGGNSKNPKYDEVMNRPKEKVISVLDEHRKKWRA